MGVQQFHRLERAAWWLEASRGDPGKPLLPWLMLTDGYRATDSVRTSPQEDRPKDSLAILLFSLRMEEDQLGRPDQVDYKVPRIWSHEN